MQLNETQVLIVMNKLKKSLKKFLRVYHQNVTYGYVLCVIILYER